MQLNVNCKYFILVFHSFQLTLTHTHTHTNKHTWTHKSSFKFLGFTLAWWVWCERRPWSPPMFFSLQQYTAPLCVLCLLWKWLLFRSRAELCSDKFILNSNRTGTEETVIPCPKSSLTPEDAGINGRASQWLAKKHSDFLNKCLKSYFMIVGKRIFHYR